MTTTNPTEQAMTMTIGESKFSKNGKLTRSAVAGLTLRRNLLYRIRNLDAGCIMNAHGRESFPARATREEVQWLEARGYRVGVEIDPVYAAPALGCEAHS